MTMDREPMKKTEYIGQAGAEANSSSVQDRLAYEKPRLLVVDLVAEEVLAVGCKLESGPGGPIGANCTASSCFAPGS
jgi:hypothetical protein